MARLVQLNGEQEGREIALATGHWRMGRHLQNEIRIEGEGISNFHAEIRVADIGVYLCDSGSTNGVFVNGRQFPKGMLANGQILQVGELRFRIELAESAIVLTVPEPIRPRSPNFFDDGTPACQIHSDHPALFKCTKCELTLCPACVRKTGLTGSTPLFFCVECSGKCVALQSSQGATTRHPLVSAIWNIVDALHVACPKFLDFRKRKK